MASPDSIAWWASLAALVPASLSDLRTRRSPNWLAIPLLGIGLAARFATGGWAGAARSLAGAAMGCVLFAIPCFPRAMGMGDLKLAAGVGAWVGPSQLVFAMVVTGIAGGAIAVCYALRHRALGTSPANTGDLISRLAHPSRRAAAAGGQGLEPRPAGSALSTAYAPAIATGTRFSLLAT